MSDILVKTVTKTGMRISANKSRPMRVASRIRSQAELQELQALQAPHRILKKKKKIESTTSKSLDIHTTNFVFYFELCGSLRC
jgi:hypothetical protein